MERTITVTINLKKNGEASFNFLDLESGDESTYRTTLGDKNDDVNECVGGELMSWLELMEVIMDNSDDDEEED